MFSYKYGNTALHLACRNGKLDVATFLVDKGASITTQDYVSTRIGYVYKQITINMNIIKKLLYIQYFDVIDNDFLCV